VYSVQDLPLLFPAVLSFRLCMAAMAAPNFPIFVLGGVLSGYRAIQLRAVPAAEPLSFRCASVTCSRRKFRQVFCWKTCRIDSPSATLSRSVQQAV